MNLIVSPYMQKNICDPLLISSLSIGLTYKPFTYILGHQQLMKCTGTPSSIQPPCSIDNNVRVVFMLDIIPLTKINNTIKMNKYLL